MSDIYEAHRRAVEEWQSACEAVRLSEELRDRKRQELDSISQRLLVSCEDPNKRVKPIVKRGRKSKANGLIANQDWKTIRPPGCTMTLILFLAIFAGQLTYHPPQYTVHPVGVPDCPMCEYVNPR